MKFASLGPWWDQGARWWDERSLREQILLGVLAALAMLALLLFAVVRPLEAMDGLQLDLMHFGAAGGGGLVEGADGGGLDAGELAPQGITLAVAEALARQIAFEGAVDRRGVGAAFGGESGGRAGLFGLFLRRHAGRGAGGGRTHIGTGEGGARHGRENKNHQAELAQAGSWPGRFHGGCRGAFGVHGLSIRTGEGSRDNVMSGPRRYL